MMMLKNSKVEGKEFQSSRMSYDTPSNLTTYIQHGVEKPGSVEDAMSFKSR